MIEFCFVKKETEAGIKFILSLNMHKESFYVDEESIVVEEYSAKKQPETFEVVGNLLCILC